MESRLAVMVCRARLNDSDRFNIILIGPCSAQRLAAKHRKNRVDLFVECKEIVFALNASRHHRKNRYQSRLLELGVCGVLNASRHHRKNREAGKKTKAIKAQVLNASRHHRKNRCHNCHNCPDWLQVLNASRHHRKNRVIPLTVFLSPSLCSTPRGITGKIASAHGYDLSAKTVLNASRHHRKNRSVPSASPLATSRVLNASRHHRKNRLYDNKAFILSRRCSTPRGITGKIAKPVFEMC